ncbi:YebC/PmpR family DNA-binding transcriptional regulator [bacterium DOLZORAL124_38_8]|nr:MAG: YebC/PmpR family DNA-binding transcriptional regulator [bacterium DOLZORAL124_38_8]
MSGHNKWSTIKHRKAANDAKRGKILTKHSKILSVVGMTDPNPDTNSALKTAITNAKSDGVPKDNIERILKKLRGEGKDGVQYAEVLYEAYAPGGVPFLISGLTDNVNRTFPQVRTAVEKSGGKLGSPNSVKFLFDQIGIILIETQNRTEDELFEIVANAGGEDFEREDEETEIFTTFDNLGAVRDALTDAGVEVKKAETRYQTKDPVKIEDQTTLDQLEKFTEKIEETCDDIDEVFGGYIINF